jgi:hypothetical protein
MITTNLSRPARFAASLLLTGVLAACSDAPTGAAITAADPPAALNAVPTVTVTNSGGYPLITWSGVSGAANYTINLITFYAINGQYQGHSPAYLVNTTSTSYLDTDHPWTGTYECVHEEDHAGDTLTVWYEYEIVTHFSNGTSSVRHFAPIAGPDQCW